VKLSKLKQHPDNRRKISAKKLELLAESIKRLPRLMELNPIVYDEKGFVHAGAQRLRALKANGLTEIPDEWTKKAENFADAELTEFRLLDNLHAGDWDLTNATVEEQTLVAMWEQEEAEAFEPRLTPTIEGKKVTQEQINKAEEAGIIQKGQDIVTVLCPHCGEAFQVTM
jgi:ParB-like chromosome segregation protein Spo0J